MAHDEFDDPRAGSALGQWFRERRQRLLAVLCVFALVFAGGLMLFLTVTDQRGESALMIVSADRTPYKSAPTDRGGMAVPNRESTVFDALQGGAAPIQDTPSEQLFAPEAASVPVDRSRAYFSELQKVAELPTPLGKNDSKTPMTNDENDPAKTGQQPVSAIPPVAVPDTNAPDSTPLPPQPAQDTLEAPPAKPVRTPLARDPDQLETAAGSPQPDPSSAGGSDYIQLASLPNESAAHQAWSGIAAKFPEALKGAGHRVVRAEIAGKGVFYRLQAGPFTRDEAIERCERIKAAAPGACMLAR